MSLKFKNSSSNAILVLILFLILGCASSKKFVKIGGVEYPKTELALLLRSRNTLVNSVGNTVFGNPSAINNLWVKPGTYKIGVTYCKFSRKKAYRPSYPHSRVIESLQEYTEEVQYIEHEFEAGKKYFVIMERDGNTVKPHIRTDKSGIKMYCTVHESWKYEGRDVCVNSWFKKEKNVDEDVEDCMFIEKYFKDDARSHEDVGEDLGKSYRWRKHPIKTFLKAL